MDLTFNEAAKGVQKTIKIEVMDVCGRCDGKGNEPGTKISRCGYCGGSGMEQIATGPFVMRSTCRKCGGTGRLISFPCVQCNGRGQVKTKKSVTVPVPAGVENGQTVRMQVGTREVFITFSVARSLIFRRQGSDVHSDVDINIAQAALGDSVRIPGVYNETELVIPPGTNSHQRFQFPGKGIKKVNSYGYGDHYVHVKISTPRKLSDSQRSLLEQLADDFAGKVKKPEPKVEEKMEEEEKIKEEKKEAENDHQSPPADSTTAEKDKEENPGFFGRMKKAVFG